MQASGPLLSGLMQQLQEVVDAAPDMTTMRQRIEQAFGQLDTSELVKLMAAAMALAELKRIETDLIKRGQL